LVPRMDLFLDFYWSQRKNGKNTQKKTLRIEVKTGVSSVF
jgi:hypothetical protein